MKQKYKKTRSSAGKFHPKIISSRMIPRPFDAIAYAAALEVLG
jgi:hypothetical protein